MNTLDLDTLGLEEMNELQMTETDGGFVPIAIGIGIGVAFLFSSCNNNVTITVGHGSGNNVQVGDSISKNNTHEYMQNSRN